MIVYSIMILTQVFLCIYFNITLTSNHVSHGLPVAELGKWMSFSKFFCHTARFITGRRNVFHTRDFYNVEINVSYKSR